MSEAKAKADKLVEVGPGLWRWWLADSRIQGDQSDSWAVVSEGRSVLVDPLALSDQALNDLRELGEIEAIILTAANHQRSAWRFRKQLGIPVFAPAGGQGLEEEPDHFYSGGDLLPGGLTPIHSPGPTEAMYALWLSRPRSVLFLSDLLVHRGKGVLEFWPDEYQDAPERTRASVRRLLSDIPIQMLCPAHGPPVCTNGRQAMQRALSRSEQAARDAKKQEQGQQDQGEGLQT